MKNSLCTLFLAVGTLLSFNIKAQIPIDYIFTQDSLVGFDDNTAKTMAFQNNCFGSEFKSFIYKAKRKFINEKYHLGHAHVNNYGDMDTDYFDDVVFTSNSVTTIMPGCSNVDFEAGSFAGWAVSKGSNSNSTTMAGCCPNTTGYVSQVINTGGNDPLVGALIPLTSPFGGSKIAKLNNATADYSVERISQTFGVTSSNAVFQFAYAGVLEAAGHSCTDQPYINVRVLDSANNVLACPKIVIVAPSATCTQPTSVTAGWTPSGSRYYHAWEIRTIDLSSYVGSNITIQITVGDCSQGAHFGYAYFDCKCNPLEITTNGNTTTLVNVDSVYISPCGAVSANIHVPEGLGPYYWDGPPGSGVTGATTFSVNTSTPGTYTVTMDPPGSCTGMPIVRRAILRFTPNPTITATASQPTCSNATGTGQITVSSGTGPFTYSWSPAAGNSGSANGLSPGETYTIIATDSLGCRDTTTLAINAFPDAPTFTITPLNGILTCSTPSITLTALTGTNTTGVWSGTTTPTLDVLTPGTYTVVLTNTVSVGQCSTSVNVTVTGNTVQPTATYSVSCNTTLISLNASSQPGIALGWLAPTLPSPSPVGNPGTSSAIGIYTLTATNLSTGCKSTYLVPTYAPDISVTTLPSRTVTCHNPTVTATASSTLSGVTITWMSGTSTYTNNPYDITAGGSYTALVTAPSGCATQSVITIISDKTDLPGITVSTNPSTVITCINTSLTAMASSTTTGTSITWNNGSSTFTTNPLTITTPGTYTANATDAGGCVSRNVFVITANNTANVLISSTSHTIPCLTNILTLTASSSPQVAYTYSWIPSNPPFTGNPYDVSEAGTYTVIAYNTTNGCTASDTYSVTKETVTAQFSANPTSGLMPLPVTLTNESINGDNYFWNLGNSSDTYTTTNAATTYDFQGTYTVTLIVTKGYCSDTASTNIIVDMVSFITIPNVFTPNGDGRNDIFSLHPINIGDISMTIFDRWGLKMYDTSSTGSLTWDGKTKGGADVADGTYFYIITAKGLDGKDFNFQGTVNIFR